jgi:CHAT domain-containing protein
MPRQVIVWAISKQEARWVRTPLSDASTVAKVRALRCGVDISMWRQSGDRPCGGELADGQLPTFDVGLAHDMYKELLAPIEGMLGNRHLMIVAKGALAQLPFNVLVTRPPDALRSQEDYRAVSWLGARQAITMLPSVQALRGIRQKAPGGGKGRPFLGIANPLFWGDPSSADDLEARRTARLVRSCRSFPASGAVPRRSAQLPRKLSLASPAVDAAANLPLLRSLSPLPETAMEVCAVAKSLGATQHDVWLGASATERHIKRASQSGELARYRIVHIATHGLLPDSSGALREAAIALTPPSDMRAQQLAIDDGLLTASEIASLKLNADWVILSACNTAGTSSPNDEPLGGLVPAFLYAGGSTLLVSHWEVYSNAAVDLITGTFAELSKSARSGSPIGRSEALRRSMAAMIGRGGSWAHPSVWAPFMLLGEGGSRSQR